MEEITIVQGRKITKGDIELVRRLIEANQCWNRTRLSQELCLLWNWRTDNGQIKDMACRTLLSKLELRGHITLPRRRSPGCRKVSIPYVPHNTASIACALSTLKPVSGALQVSAFPVSLSFVSAALSERT